jgi:hypothetical protein
MSIARGNLNDHESNIRRLSAQNSQFHRASARTLFDADELERLTAFMLALVDRCQFPPMRGNTVDWSEISMVCNIHTRLTAKQ